VFTDNIAYIGKFGHGTRMKFVANHLRRFSMSRSPSRSRSRALDSMRRRSTRSLRKALCSALASIACVATSANRRHLPATMKVGLEV
jgi:hypothetical protein